MMSKFLPLDDEETPLLLRLSLADDLISELSDSARSVSSGETRITTSPENYEFVKDVTADESHGLVTPDRLGGIDRLGTPDRLIGIDESLATHASSITADLACETATTPKELVTKPFNHNQYVC